MATISDTSISVGGARDLLKASKKLQIEVLERDPYLAMFKAFGILNIEDKLTSESGSVVTMYNAPRIIGLGTVGDFDRYSSAQSLESGDRTLTIRAYGKPVKYALKGSERQQISEFDLKARTPRQLAEYMKSYCLTTMLFQAGGNTATTLYAPDIEDVAVTATADRLILTGHNTAIAPSARYKGIGTLGAGSVTADEDVVAGNPLTLADFMAAREVITSTDNGIPVWNRLQRTVEGMKVDAVAMVSTTGMNQLKNDAVTVGQGLNFAQFTYAQLAGGKGLHMPSSTYIYEGIAFVEVPDHLLPRGVHSSTAASVANTRRAVMLGTDALDYAMGKGYSMGGNTVAGFEINTDDTRDKLNKQGYSTVELNAGCKKVQIAGTGANASTSYDLATYVITHYSRT